MVARVGGDPPPPVNLMSRRKQPNPKPLKRKAEDELEELSELLQVPRDALALQGCSDDEGEEEGETDCGALRLQARVALSPGRLFGPYGGYITRQIQDLQPSEAKDAKLEAVDEGGKKLWVILKDDTGAWMKLLKPSSSPDTANLSIYSDGVTIWCSVTSSLEPEDELRAIYRGERVKGALNGDMTIKQEVMVNGDVTSVKEEEELIIPDGRPTEEEVAHSVTSGMGIQAFPYGLQPGSLPLGSNLIYVPLLGQQQTSPRPASVCSAASDQEKTQRVGFTCAPCGITFSSQSTLMAHQAIYCSFRNTAKCNNTGEANEQNSDHERTSTPKSGQASPARSSSASGKRVVDEERPSEDGVTSDGDTSSQTGDAKSARTGRLYQCPRCSYVTERKGGLTRHMRIHASPPVSDHVESTVPRSLSRYCANCDIQFASQKTYHVHKTYYCSTRHGPKGATTSPNVPPEALDVSKLQKVVQDGKVGPQVAGDPKSNSGLVFGHPFYAAISTSPLILVPCSYLPGGGLAPASGIISAGNIVIPNGKGEASPISPVPAFTILPTPSTKPEAAAVKVKPPKRDETPESKASGDGDEAVESPLDLSIRRRSSEELNRSPSVPTELPVPRTSMTPPKSVVVPPMASPGLCGGSASIVTAEAMSAQILVKQGNSKCKECNIVFYKYENYLAHKRNYCASRIQKMSGRPGSSPEAPKREPKERDVTSPENSVSPGHHPTTSQSPKSSSCQSPPSSQPMCQYYCVACGITFTSLDNLQAHQTYYCSKRDTLAANTVPESARGFGFKCAKCKSSFTSEEFLKNHPCGLQRKCPYCDVFCPTLSAAQRHLVTHTGVKAFRCTICGYKGHTLRGMRTHIRIHLDANNGAPEENFIVCVGEDGVAVGTRKNSTSESSAGSPVDTSASDVSKVRDNSTGVITADAEGVSNSCDSSHCCQFCGYTSSYKGNVVRHIKLVHRDLLSPSVQRPTSAGSASGDKSVDYVWPVKKEAVSVDSDVSNDSRPAVKMEEVSSNHSSSPPPPTELSEGVEVKVEEDQSKKNGPKYCKSCDISFNHLSNFIAHKKYYCTTQPVDPIVPEPTVV